MKRHVCNMTPKGSNAFILTIWVQGEELDVYFRAALEQARKIRVRLNALADTVTELHYRRWLCEKHSLDLTPPADGTPDALSTHIKAVKQFLSEDVVKDLDYRLEGAVYPTETEVEALIKDIRQTARDITVIAHGSSNRRINAGGTPLPVLFKLAPLADRKLRLQKGKDTLKIAWNPPTFEELGIHNALKRSAARQHLLQVQLEHIRHRRGLAPLPTPLRTDDAAFIHNFRPHFQWNGTPSMFIPKVKQGTQRLWFQARDEPQDNVNLGKNVFQVYSSKADANLRPLVKRRDTVKIKWYHKEEGAITDGPSHNYRRYASRKAWEEAHATEANLEVLKPEIRNMMRSESAAGSTGSPDDTRLPRIIKQHMNPPSPLVRRAFIREDPSSPGGNGVEIEDATSTQSAPSSITNSPDSSRVQKGRAGQRARVRYYPSVRPEQPQSHIHALWGARNSLANTSAGQTRMYSTTRMSTGRPKIVSKALIFLQAVLTMCICRVRVKMNITCQISRIPRASRK